MKRLFVLLAVCLTELGAVLAEPATDDIQLWGGSRAETSADLNVTLTFTHPSANPPQASAFEVLVALGTERVTVRSNATKDQQYAGGVRLPYPSTDKRFLYLEGKGRTGLYIEVLPSISAPHAGHERMVAYQVTLCPRAFTAVQSSATGSILLDSGYLASTLRYEGVQAIARGGFRSGLNRAVAKAQIVTSPGLSPSDPAEDISQNLNPEVDLEYLPASKQVEVVEVADQTSAQLSAKLEFTAPSGHRRERASVVELEIKETSTEQTSSIKLWGTEFPVEKGRCYAIIKRQTERDRYFAPSAPALP